MDGMNKTKWKAMSRRDKLEFIKFYYGKTIIVSLTALIIAVILIVQVATSVKPDLSILMLNNVYQEEFDFSAFDEFCEQYGYDNSEGKIAVLNNFFILTEEEGADQDTLVSSHQNMSALQNWLVVGEDDVIIGYGLFMKNSLIDGEAFLDLREVFTPEQLEQYSEYIVYGQPVDLDEEYEDVMEELTEPYPCALRLDNNPWIVATGCYTTNCYVAIPAQAGNKEAGTDFLLYLLSLQP